MIKSLSNDAVHALLSPENNVVYTVPKYQREYSWGRDQWDELVDDLLDHADVDGHFLGTIICVNNTANTTSESVLEIIDGQQRLTTISLMLAAIHSLLQEHRADLSDDDAVDLVNLRRMLILREPVRARLRPQTQNDNAEDFLHVLAEAGLGVADPKPRWAGVRRVKKAYVHFRSRITSRAAETQSSVAATALDLLGRVKRANIVKLEVATHADAFTLFESLNNRGMPLTPIDLIKNTLLGRADHRSDVSLDGAYARWREWLAILGDDYGTQERFFRYFYNAMKDEFDIGLQGVPVATRTNLIKIYETLIDRDLVKLLDDVTVGVEAFGQLIGSGEPEGRTRLARAFQRLRRAQGVPAHVLLLYLVIQRTEINLGEDELVDIVDLLTAFFVRRNLTGTPATYGLVRLFMDLVARLRTSPTQDRKQLILDALTAVSESDEGFHRVLSGPVYEVNSDVVRFILASLAERRMTAETEQDLWHRIETKGKPVYRWSIEHILPQGENLPPGWVSMLGGPAAATEARERFAHHLGNLTITGFNSSLGNRSFIEKRDRVDSNGNSIGYRNGLSLNSDLAVRESWGIDAISARTEQLAGEAMAAFPLAYRT